MASSRKRLIGSIVVLALLAAGMGGFAIARAQGKSYATLSTFRLNDVDGNEVSLEDAQLKGKRVLFCVVASWSNLAEAQARQVLRLKSGYSGKIVFLASGPDREVRDMRKRLGSENDLWLLADSETASKLGAAFGGEIASLNRAPALVAIDEARKAVFASAGELSDAEVREAFAATAK